MNDIAKFYKSQGVESFVLYTREPHAGEKTRAYDFSDKKQTETHEERVDYALEMVKKITEGRTILIDTFGEDCLQNTIGGSMPNSLIVVG